MGTLHDWAATVLEGQTLDDKLLPPPPHARRCPARGPAAGTRPPAPGRPQALRFPTPGASGRAAAAFPRDLRSAEARGVVLHFFANHELLALELMALAILRFPETPAAFRAGLATVIVDEQRHLAGYLARMEACGIALGSVPVNRFFWDALAPVEDPLRFVAGLSLTFEQANLDFAHHYARAFREAGDEDTAAVLDGVLEDELRHVRHGLGWFDRWRAPDLTRWAAWVGALPPPLTPSRARGTVFVRALRAQVGLDEDFVARIEVHGASKGRPPRVHTFHPEVERDVLGLPTSPAARSVEGDLAVLLVFLATTDDVVIAPRAPGVAWLAEVGRAGFALPEVVEATPERAHAALAGRRLGGVRPWGTSPRVDALLAPLRAQVDPAAVDTARWQPGWESLYDKAWAADLLATLLRDSPSDTCVDTRCVGRVCPRWEDVADLASNTEHRWVAKARWGTAGRSAWRLGEPDAEQAVRRALAEQGTVLVEPWLTRVLDLSVQIDVLADGTVRVHPWGRFLCDAAGRYKGAVVGRALADLGPAERRAVAEAVPVLEAAARLVGGALHTRGYVGPAGLDALIARTGDGRLRCKPIVEVNPRVTMGRVAAALGRRVAPGTVGLVRQVSRREAGGDFREWARRLRERAPLHVERRGGAPMITGGAFFTTDPDGAVHLCGVMVVAESLAGAEARLGGAHGEPSG